LISYIRVYKLRRCIVARCEAGATEEKLKVLIENWHDRTMDELSELLDVSEETIDEWVFRLKKTMRAQGMTEELIDEVFPPMGKPGKIDCFESVVRQLFVTPKSGAIEAGGL